MRYTARDLLRQGRLQETTGTTVDLKYSEVDCWRPVETRKTTGDCRGHWGL